MLKIKNYDKLLRRNAGPWRISRVERTQTAYLIQLMKPDGEKMQVNLERIPIGEQYELWCWNDDRPTAVPIRTMMSLKDLKIIDLLMGGIEFLIRNKMR